jgi:hypothetical protein
MDGALSSFCGVDHGDGVETFESGLSVPDDDGGELLANATEVNRSPATVVVIATERARIVNRDCIRWRLVTFVLIRFDTLTPDCGEPSGNDGAAFRA